MRPLHRIGIIIVTYQSARYVAPLWRSLAATIDPQRTTICVFDNASSDETVALLKRENEALPLPLQLICSETNLGFPHANNVAFDQMQAEASHDVLILINPDTVVHPGWWEALLQALEDPDVAVVAPLLLLPDGKINSRGNALHFLGLGYVQGLNEEVSASKLDEPFFSVSGAALAIKMEALAAMNELLGTSRLFWSELFMYTDDVDLGWRVRLAGFESRLCAESRVTHDYHFPTSNTMAVESRLFWIERNRYLLLISNFKIATLLVLLPWIIASEVALACGFWNLYSHRLYLWRKVWKEIWSPAFGARRHHLQVGRKRKDRDILLAMTGSIRHGARDWSIFDRLVDGMLRCSHRLLCWVVWW